MKKNIFFAVVVTSVVTALLIWYEIIPLYPGVSRDADEMNDTSMPSILLVMNGKDLKVTFQVPATLLGLGGEGDSLSNKLPDVMEWFNSDGSLLSFNVEASCQLQDSRGEMQAYMQTSETVVEITQQVHCETPSGINKVTANVFSHLPELEKLHLIWSTDSEMGAVAVTANNPSVGLNFQSH